MRSTTVMAVVLAAIGTAACADNGPGSPVRATDARSIGATALEPAAEPAASDTPSASSVPLRPDDVAPADAGAGTEPIPTADVHDIGGDSGTGTVVDESAKDPAGGDTAAVDPSSAQFVETFDANRGFDRFRYGVYHRDVGHHEAGRAPQLSGWNNASHGGTWTADHDLDCGSPDTQRPLQSDFEQDTTGANDWQPYVDLHLDELLFTCRDHLMTSMGDVAAYSIVWFSPDQVFDTVSSVSFDVNLTDLGNRQWWKVGVVSDELFNSTWLAGSLGVPAPGHLVSDVGASDLDDLVDDDRLIASWSGGASAGHPGAMKIGNTKLGGGFDAGADKKTRHPVSLVDNDNGTLTFDVAGSTSTTSGSFPECPCRVVFYDHNYTPDKDGEPIGHTWHWDNFVVS